jgi:Holliday junction resolvase-like predicted endonuclease
MNSLNFENTFNKESGNVGDLFQSFVFELLRKSDYPKLHKFQTAGKDGGIDLIQQLNNERTVVECKYIGDNSIETIQALVEFR